MQIGSEYELFRSDGWGGFDEKLGRQILGRNCWVYTFTPTGYNGAGGFWGIEKTKWASGGTHHDQPMSLSWKETCQMEDRLFARHLMEDLGGKSSHPFEGVKP